MLIFHIPNFCYGLFYFILERENSFLSLNCNCMWEYRCSIGFRDLFKSSHGSIYPSSLGMFYAMSSILLRIWCSEEDAVSIMLIFFLGME